MDIRNIENHVFNIKLAKLITGLYQLLDPGTVKYRGRNIYHIAMVCVLLCMSLISLILSLSGLYYWTNNISISMDYFWKSEVTLYTIYKMWLVVHYSNDIWNCLSIARYDFTPINDQNRHILDRWRQRLAFLTTIIAIMYLIGTVSYLVITLAFGEDKSPVKSPDGSIEYYRQNAINLYLIVSDETYNAHYHMFYFVEALYVIFMGLFFLIFDCLLVTLCFCMCCQMQIICSAFESVGHKSLRDTDSRISDVDSTDENINMSPNEHGLIYNELKTIIMDHQRVIEKYEDFLTLFRRVIFLHIFVSSLTVISVLFPFIMSFSNDERFKTSKIVVEKLFCSIPPILFQIFMVCHLFDKIHDQTMGNCYTVISVLVNYIQTKDT